VIAATNRNLSDEVTQQRFRADLFYRLNVVSLHIPTLRERTEDIQSCGLLPCIYRKRFGRPQLNLSDEARARLQTYSWPANVRELRNCLERAAALSADDTIEVDQIPVVLQRPPERRHSFGAAKLRCASNWASDFGRTGT